MTKFDQKLANSSQKMINFGQKLANFGQKLANFGQKRLFLVKISNFSQNFCKMERMSQKIF